MSLAEDRFPGESRDAARLSLTGHERLLGADDIIVSKTDLRGVMGYVNDTFLGISGYTEMEMLGKPHSVIRHPHMPRCIFKLLWDTIKSGNEIFAYVVNRCKNGDHYWVLAHVTPTLSMTTSKPVGYHSNRRAPRRDALKVIEPLYRELRQIEDAAGGRAGLDASTRRLHDLLAQKNVSYDHFVLSI